jgi:aerobic carbon-monoxide dehydrogenase large subunit
MTQHPTSQTGAGRHVGRGRSTPLIGASVPRQGTTERLTGATRYVADLHASGEVHARVVRSPLAHALITGIDTTEARAYPGVLAVITADDLPDVRIPIRLPFAETPEAAELLQPPLARGEVRYVGEPVAVVVATDAYVAEDAAELVEVDYDELAVAVTVDDALAVDAPLVFAGRDGNAVSTVRLGHGDADAAFAEADVVITDRLDVHRHTAVPMETRGLLAVPEGDGIVVHGAAKVKHFTRQAVAGMLGIDPGRLRLVEAAVGGGFGVRGEPYPEDFLIPFLALRLGRPVKWVEDRAEHFVATNHARESHFEVEIAATKDGDLLAFRVNALCDHGGYVRSQGILPELLPVLHLAGPYRWRAFTIASTGVLTNRTPVGTYRGPGMTEATFARERMLDRLAARIGVDPVELRRRNLIPADALPFTFDPTPGSSPVVPLTYESGDFPGSLDLLLDHVDYQDLLRQQAARRDLGQLVGIGMATYMEVGAIGPFEHAEIHPGREGRLTVKVGVGALGQGVETVLAQIAADELGVPLEQVAIDCSDTDAVPIGFGAFASRSTTLAGNAIALAARDLRAKAAKILGADPEEVSLTATEAVCAHSRVPLADVGPGQGRFDKPHPSFSFGAALSVVNVDNATGKVRVERHIVLHDVGRAVNPALLRAQLAGAAAQGIGAALLEELAYDEHGQPLSTSFADYLMPTAAELPDTEVIVVEHPTPSNPLGVKGAGESGMVATPAAIANAVADALGPSGHFLKRLPLTPRRVRPLLLYGALLAMGGGPIPSHSSFLEGLAMWLAKEHRGHRGAGGRHDRPPEPGPTSNAPHAPGPGHDTAPPAPEG